MENLRDEELIQKCLAGQTDAFGLIVQRYEKQIFSLAYRLCSNYDEAADMAQEAFVHIFRMLDRFDMSKRFFPWMYRVAHNSCINYLNKRPQSGVSLDEYAEVITDDRTTESQPEAHYDNEELRQHIDEAIMSLPDNYREPVHLRYIENMSYQQIAEVMGVPVSTVETRLFRGRQLLQKSLAKYLTNK